MSIQSFSIHREHSHTQISYSREYENMKFAITELPDELLLIIIEFMSLKTIMNLKSTSYKFYNLINDRPNLNDIPKKVIYKIFDNLSKKGKCNFALTSTRNYELVLDYIDDGYATPEYGNAIPYHYM